MSFAANEDPFQVLGVSPDASEAEIRARYLSLVKQHPPERDAEMFRRVRTAFEATKDPLAVARRLLAPPDDNPPGWLDVLEQQKKAPPRLSLPFMLSLGNRPGSAHSTSPVSAPSANPTSTATSPPSTTP